LTEAKLERRFRAGERDLRRLYAGYYVAEMLRELTDENDPAPELFDLASLTLVQLDADTEVDACLLRFEIQLLRLVGQMPTLESCATCGTRLELPDAEADSARIPFGWQAGGLLCGRCRGSARGVALVRGSSLRWIRQARAATTGPPPPLRTTEAGELRGLFNHYLTHLTGGPPRMRPFITGRSH
jgi:DNA repair protein RecO (recombination protein O)